jgi:hypothetical protein
MTRTFLQTVLDVADALGLHEQGTLTGATTTALTAATYPFRTNRTDASSKKYEGAEVYLEGAAGNVTPNPNGVSAYVASTGVFTPSNTYANAPGTTLVFDLFTRGVGIQQIRDAINEALRNMHYTTWVPLTFVVDGDCDSSGVTDWTAGGSAALSKVTNTNLRHGPQALRVLASGGANGQAASTAMLVDPNYARDWYATVAVRAQVGTARFIAYDNTNSANITTQDWTSQGWGRVGFQFTLPATCESWSTVHRAVASSDDSYWDDVCAFPLGVTEFPLPSWVTRADQVLDVRQGWDLAPADRVDEMRTAAVPYEIQEDFANPNNQFKLVFKNGFRTSGPLWLKAHRQFPALSLDADTTFADREWLSLAAQVFLLEKLIARPASEEVTAWKNLLLGTGPRPGKRAQLRAMNLAMNPFTVAYAN